MSQRPSLVGVEILNAESSSSLLLFIFKASFIFKRVDLAHRSSDPGFQSTEGGETSQGNHSRLLEACERQIDSDIT